MGILNITPDSFSDGGKFFNHNVALSRAIQLEAEGADIIDIGAESTRPGAKVISAEEEISRLFPLLEKILEKVSVPVSIDTTKARVADRALSCGVSIVNDVSGLRADPEIADVVCRYEAGIILMHSRGTPETMQTLTNYDDLVSGIFCELSASVEFAKAAGISEEQIAVDPGIGFAKTREQCFEIVNRFSEFQKFGRPLVAGASRKSFLGQTDEGAPETRASRSAAVAALLAERGANVLRVHDVRLTKDAVNATKELMA